MTLLMKAVPWFLEIFVQIIYMNNRYLFFYNCPHKAFVLMQCLCPYNVLGPDEIHITSSSRNFKTDSDALFSNNITGNIGKIFWCQWARSTPMTVHKFSYNLLTFFFFTLPINLIAIVALVLAAFSFPASIMHLLTLRAPGVPYSYTQVPARAGFR